MFLGSDGLTHQSTMSEYCLRWNNHQPNLVAVFSELLHSEALVDVTLATDGHFIHAHKLVLSACSMYFKDLFASNPCKHPIVILKDIKIDDLKTVIDFIYRGEVNVSQDRLQDVLKTAESLRIKGLTENPRSIDDVASQGQRLSSSSLGSQTARQVSSFSEQSLSIEGDDDKVETTSSTGPKKRKLPPSMGSSESVYDNDSENNDEKRIKDEPTDEKVLPRDRSRETDSDHSVVSRSAVAGAMIMLQQQGIEGGEEASSQGPSGGDPGTSASHAQGSSSVMAMASLAHMAATGAPEPYPHPNLHPKNPLPPSSVTQPFLQPSFPSTSFTFKSSTSPPPSHRHPHPSSSAPFTFTPASPYPKLHAANGATVTIRHGTPHQFLRAIEEVREGRMGFCKAGRLFGVSHATLQKYYKAMGYTLRNQTNNPNFRRNGRPDGMTIEPRRRYFSVPADVTNIDDVTSSKVTGLGFSSMPSGGQIPSPTSSGVGHAPPQTGSNVCHMPSTASSASHNPPVNISPEAGEVSTRSDPSVFPHICFGSDLPIEEPLQELSNEQLSK